MSRSKLTHVLITAALLVTLSTPVFGAEDGGTRSHLSHGAGNRALGLGGAYTSVADDASAPLWNPAGLGFVEQRELQATRTSLYGLDISEEYLGFVLPHWKWGSAAITLRHLGVSGIEGRDGRNVITDGDLTNSETQVMLSYGRRLGEAWSVGGSLKFQHQSLAELSATGIGGDVGVLVYPGLALNASPSWSQNLALGLSLNNLLEPSLRLNEENVPDPLTVRLGLSYRRPIAAGRFVLLAFDLERSRDQGAQFHAGLEFKVHSLLTLRTGMSDGMLTAGSGIHWHNLAFDYVFEDNPLGSVHRLGLGVRFGSTVEESRLAALRAEEEKLQNRLADAFDRRQEERTNELLKEAEDAYAEGRYGDALSLLDAAQTLSPDRADVGRVKAETLYENAKDLEAKQGFAEAAVLYDRVLLLDPQHAAAVSGASRCRAESDRRAQRTADLQSQFSAALDAFSGGDLLRAQSGFQAILQTEPGDEDAALMLARTEKVIDREARNQLDRAESLIRAGALAEAADAVRSASMLRPNARGLSHTNRLLAEATDAAAERRRQSSLDTTRSVKKTGPSTHGSQKTRKQLSREKQREVEDLYKRGLAAMDRGDSNEALRYWDLVFSMSPDHHQVRERLKQEYLLRGMDSFAAGKLNDAVSQWEKALAVDPKDEKAKGYLSRAREQLARAREISREGER